MPDAVIVSAVRSPIGRARMGSLAGLRPDNLAAQMVSAALAALPELDPRDIDDLFLGCGQPGGEQGFNMARTVAVQLGYDFLPGFTGRTVVVTGAARGIGLAVAQRFQAAHAVVFMVDYDRDELQAAAQSVGASAAPADVSRTGDAERVVAAVVEKTGRVDVLVNNAGVLRDKVLWKLSDDDWENVLSMHAGGTFRFTRACVPHFRARQYGRVINVTSYTGLRGNRGQANYSTAKAGINGFTMTAAKELAAFGVTVNALSPNAETRMTATIPPDRIPELTGPIQRFADPQEIAAAVCFLASDEAGYITGVTLPVDGGLTL